MKTALSQHSESSDSSSPVTLSYESILSLEDVTSNLKYISLWYFHSHSFSLEEFQIIFLLILFYKIDVCIFWIYLISHKTPEVEKNTKKNRNTFFRYFDDLFLNQIDTFALKPISSFPAIDTRKRYKIFTFFF